MFGNILYVIVALLIYSTYPVSEQPGFSPTEALGFFLVTAGGFAAVVRFRFQRLWRMSETLSRGSLGPALDSLQTRLSILALGVFAFDVYGLGLPSHTARIPLFQLFPTLQALLFLLLFIAYMCLVWAMGHPGRRHMDGSHASRIEHVRSNIQLAVPVLLPWLILSVVTDLLQALPLPAVHRFLASPTGELVYFITFLLAVAVFGPVLIQRFWGCRPLSPGLDRFRIEALCRRAGVRYAQILQWPLFGGRMITAGVMGLVGRFRYILVTPALLEFLRPEEINAVIAHEIGHVKRHHLLYYLFFFTGYMLLSLLVLELAPLLIITVKPLYHWIDSSGIAPATAVSTLFSVCVIAVFLLYFRFLFGYFMRNFERQADAYVYTLFDSALPMISTFQKIALTSGQPPDKPNWHHFSIAQRVGFLRRCEDDPSQIHRHDRKVRLSLILYTIVLVCVAAAAWSLNYGETGRRLGSRALEQILHRQIEKHPGDADLHTALGDLYYSRNHFENAQKAYQNAVEMDSKNARALNNLAWLLLTCEDRRLRNPVRGLRLARRAAALDPAPHVLDTLAEALFANGDVAAAVATEKRALAAADGDRHVFQAQLEKFQRALR